MKYLIWNFERMAWWRDGQMGYTSNVLQAGRYSFDDAFVICNGANIGANNKPEEAMVPDYVELYEKRKRK